MSHVVQLVSGPLSDAETAILTATPEGGTTLTVLAEHTGLDCAEITTALGQLRRRGLIIHRPAVLIHRVPTTTPSRPRRGDADPSTSHTDWPWPAA